MAISPTRPYVHTPPSESSFPASLPHIPPTPAEKADWQNFRGNFSNVISTICDLIKNHPYNDSSLLIDLIDTHYSEINDSSQKKKQSLSRYKRELANIIFYDEKLQNANEALESPNKELEKLSYIKAFLQDLIKNSIFRKPLTPLDLFVMAYNLDLETSPKNDFEIALGRSARSIIDLLKNLKFRDENLSKLCKWLFILDKIFTSLEYIKMQSHSSPKDLLNLIPQDNNSAFETGDFSVHFEKYVNISQQLISIIIFTNIFDSFPSELLKNLRNQLLNLLSNLLNISTKSQFTPLPFEHNLDFSCPNIENLCSDLEKNWEMVSNVIKRDFKNTIVYLIAAFQEIKMEKLQQAHSSTPPSPKHSPSIPRKITKSPSAHSMTKSNPQLPYQEVRFDLNQTPPSTTPTRTRSRSSSFALPSITSLFTTPEKAKKCLEEKEPDAASLSDLFSFKRGTIGRFNKSLGPFWKELHAVDSIIEYLTEETQSQEKTLLDILQEAFPRSLEIEKRIRNSTADSIINILTTYPFSQLDQKQYSRWAFIINQIYVGFTDAWTSMFDKCTKVEVLNVLPPSFYDLIFNHMIRNITYISILASLSPHAQKELEQYKQEAIVIMNQFVIFVANKFKALDRRTFE